MREKREKFEQMLKERQIFIDPDTIMEVVSDFLTECANDLKENEPYAINEIRDYEKAAYVVFSVLNEQ